MSGAIEVEFLCGATDHKQLIDAKSKRGAGNLPVVAIAGRSNVGKSSLLNVLTGARIARVSQAPGRTREINLFRWQNMVIADLPGYGFAKVSQSLRAQWGEEIPRFLGADEQLRFVVSLADGRHGFSADDKELVAFLTENEVPFCVVFTKMDKMKSANQRGNAERLLRQQAAALGVENPLFVSSIKKQGVGQLAQLMRERCRK